jgi:hypothetical protein
MDGETIMALNLGPESSIIRMLMKIKYALNLPALCEIHSPMTFCKQFSRKGFTD